MVKHLSAVQETQVQSLGYEDPLEKEMVAHSSTLAWKIPWIAEPGRLPSMGSQRVRHDWKTSLSPNSVSNFLSCYMWPSVIFFLKFPSVVCNCPNISLSVVFLCLWSMSQNKVIFCCIIMQHEAVKCNAWHQFYGNREGLDLALFGLHSISRSATYYLCYLSSRANDLVSLCLFSLICKIE